MTKTVLIVAATLTFLATFSANAQQFRNVDREYEEAEHLCKRLVGEPGTMKRFLVGMGLSECIMRRLGLRKPTQPFQGDIRVHRD